MGMNFRWVLVDAVKVLARAKGPHRALVISSLMRPATNLSFVGGEAWVFRVDE